MSKRTRLAQGFRRMFAVEGTGVLRSAKVSKDQRRGRLSGLLLQKAGC